ncbi:BnaA02g29750D [Brassica napus]|uniref:(rape) hypothetical protein n=1 Tax=Brassica napus TaxID=3708 RepID=A0A078I2Z4_BRANA|nr:unnamed protein product [Brassica napus]CDY44402.1 BnaA02g29750D [Brassica napus]
MHKAHNINQIIQFQYSLVLTQVVLVEVLQALPLVLQVPPGLV